ncbi:MAG TPA: hypothetical protein VND20_01220 [Candidatus Binataceae bacterium]|nr:hypothetical protein [Candidatus Binataceae bacterium]
MPSAGGQRTASAAINPAAPALHDASVEAPENGPPPALDVGTIAAGPDLSDSSLAPEITRAPTPAMAASLRVTEAARKELIAGHADNAIRDLGRAVSIDPGDPFEYFYLGRSYMAENNYDQALTFLERAEIGFAARPEWLGETVGFEGACYEEQGKLPEAALAYQRAVGAAPANLMARVGYSRLAANLPPPPNPNPPASPAEESTALPIGDAAEPAPEELPPPPPPHANEAPAVAPAPNDPGAD